MARSRLQRESRGSADDQGDLPGREGRRRRNCRPLPQKRGARRRSTSRGTRRGPPSGIRRKEGGRGGAPPVPKGLRVRSSTPSDGVVWQRSRHRWPNDRGRNDEGASGSGCRSWTPSDRSNTSPDASRPSVHHWPVAARICLPRRAGRCEARLRAAPGPQSVRPPRSLGLGRDTALGPLAFLARSPR